jgi:hypothetical protein
MEELYLLDEELNKKHIIDTYSSVIWTPRYNTLGDCELVIQASQDNLKKIKECRYISRDDDEMVCEIKKIEIQTDEENGDQIIVTGIDVKDILNKRIVMNQTNFNGLVEDYIRMLITDAFINPKDPNRKISNFVLADKQGFTETIREQVTYDYIGDKVQELCQQFGWGYKVTVKNGNFVFSLYKGKDKSQYITFSQNYDNISTTDYQEDNSNIKNVALIAGEGEGVDRKTTTIGSGEGINRNELYVDARDVSSTIDYDELLNNYPNGIEKVINNVIYYQVNGTNIAILTKDEKGEVSEVKLCDNIYTENLKSVGNEKMAEYVSVTSFTGDIIVGINYKYKEDYNLGDIVNILNEYGMSVNARITEIIESRDDNGYTMEPTFENI